MAAALSLFHEMGLPLTPTNSQTPILVWGGSTSVGQYAIQLAK
jgi:NADPH:quinone reductase-like Zn-dependent oxidoreductase